MTAAPPARDLTSALVRFCRRLRARGMAVTPAESIDALRVLDALDLSDRDEVYLALRTVLTSRVDDYPIYDELFATLWAEREAGRASAAEAEAEAEERPERERPAPPGGPAPQLSLEQWLALGDPGSAEPAGLPTVSAQERLADKDFTTFETQDLEAVTKVAQRIARRLAARPGRRWRATRRGPRVHPRRTARRALRTGGDPVELTYRRRKLKKTRLVVLCDVSGSMDLYSRFLLQFIYALQNCFARVETFLFSTRLSRVTDELRDPSYPGALDRLARQVHDFSGGTRIGECLAEYQRTWGRAVDRRTIVVILSDGWDTGEPEALGRTLRSLHKRAGRLIWLNPLLGSPGYRPETRGMRAALPHLDVFAPAHNLESLRALVPHLRL